MRPSGFLKSGVKIYRRLGVEDFAKGKMLSKNPRGVNMMGFETKRTFHGV